MSHASHSRRAFLTRLAQGAALTATGGLVWAYLLEQQARATPFALRPPGARPEDDFNALCIKCGQCARACPYDTLQLAPAGADMPIGTPHFVPREVPCYLCEDIPCQVACPTGALGTHLETIDDARMGLAVIDRENCLSWQGLRCEICHRECPLQDDAITVETHPRKISRHAMFVPVVHSSHCTGCGICEQACPTELAAIRVLPRRLVEGRMGDHYRYGWREDAPPLPESSPQDAPGAGGTPGLDYLNEDGL